MRWATISIQGLLVLAMPALEDKLGFKTMKQRFLNQKLGKRNSRRAELQKAKQRYGRSEQDGSRSVGHWKLKQAALALH